MITFAWFVWRHGYHGIPKIGWLDPKIEGQQRDHAIGNESGLAAQGICAHRPRAEGGSDEPASGGGPRGASCSAPGSPMEARAMCELHDEGEEAGDKAMAGASRSSMRSVKYKVKSQPVWRCGQSNFHHAADQSDEDSAAGLAGSHQQPVTAPGGKPAPRHHPGCDYRNAASCRASRKPRRHS
jgi:hypothetical protein